MPDSDGNPDPRKPCQITVVGRKGSGKTELAYLYFDSYPRDKMAIDPNGDLILPDTAMLLESPVGTRWPGEAYERLHGKKKQQILHMVPNVEEPDYLDEMDRAVGMCFAHGHTCLLFDECQIGAPAGRTPPHMRRALWQGRHSPLTLILSTPRPITVDSLVLSQADWVYVFDLPNPADRRRVADSIGWNPKDFDAGVESLTEFAYLRYDRARKDLAKYPPLPASAIRHHHPAGT